MSEKIVQLNEEVIKGQIKELVRGSVEETLTYCDFPCEHWTRIRTNNVIERPQPGDSSPYPRGGGLPGWKLRPHAGVRQASPCGRYPVGQQEVHEHEAPGRCLWPGRPCWLTAFNSEICKLICA